MTSTAFDELRLQYQSFIGSFNGLAHTTHPDLSMVVSLLFKHQSMPLPGHYNAALYVTRFLANTKSMGIYFSSTRCCIVESFLHFLMSTSFLSILDANWGPQDATLTGLSQDLPLFASHSMSAFYIDSLGPLHWMSKRLQMRVQPKQKFM
jgi:hypothetical protein